jgi:protein-disulfide isomerase
VAWYEANRAEDEISSTPSFIINGVKYANMSYAELQKILDAQ